MDPKNLPPAAREIRSTLQKYFEEKAFACNDTGYVRVENIHGWRLKQGSWLIGNSNKQVRQTGYSNESIANLPETILSTNLSAAQVADHLVNLLVEEKLQIYLEQTGSKKIQAS